MPVDNWLILALARAEKNFAGLSHLQQESLRTQAVDLIQRRAWLQDLPNRDLKDELQHTAD